MTTGWEVLGVADGEALAELGGALDGAGEFSEVPVEMVELVSAEAMGLLVAWPHAAVSTATPAMVASMNLLLVLRDVVLAADN